VIASAAPWMPPWNDADRDIVLAEDAVDLRPIGGAPRDPIESVNEDAIDEPFGHGRDEAKEAEAVRVGA
jgi:hypothetical protein